MKRVMWISTTTSMATMLGWHKRWPRDIPTESKPHPVLNFVPVPNEASGYDLGIKEARRLENQLGRNASRRSAKVRRRKKMFRLPCKLNPTNGQVESDHRIEGLALGREV